MLRMLIVHSLSNCKQSKKAKERVYIAARYGESKKREESGSKLHLYSK